MKLLFLCAATALAAAPPRIELNLASGARTSKLADSAFRSSDPYFTETANFDRSQNPTTKGNLARSDKTEVFNRQDWSQNCQVLPNSGTYENDKCPLPVAKAWDHADRDISGSIKTSIYYVDRDSKACKPRHSKDKDCTVTRIDYGTRGTYLIKYDVKDQAGNKAEQVVFALVIDDQCGAKCEPTIAICGDSSEQWEAATKVKLCRGTTASDHIPVQTLTEKLEYSIHRIHIAADGTQNTAGQPLCDHVAYAGPNKDLTCADKALTTTICRDDANKCDPESFLVTFHVCDNAFKYGPNAKSNCVSANKVITISDNTKPIITVLGWGAEPGTPLKWECHHDARIHRSDCTKEGDHTVSGYSGKCWHGKIAKRKSHCVPKFNSRIPKNSGHRCKAKTNKRDCEAVNWNDGTGFNDNESDCEWKKEDVHQSGDFEASYSNFWHDNGATVFDTLDTDKLNFKITPTATQTPRVDTTQIGEYTVTYNAHDRAGNQASSKVRHVQVRDTLAPTVELDGFEFVKDIHDAPDKNLHHETTVHFSLKEAPLWEEPEWHCHDVCDMRGDAMKLKPQWDKPWNDRVIGDYYRTYTCRDASNNEHSAVRKFTVKDKTAPVITVMGLQEQTIEATVDAEYTDQGATCHDYVDGVLSHAVEVSGQVVNMRLPGNYTIRYDCQDLSGNKAIPMHRVVSIVDSTCPKITMLGASPVYIEAGFDYTDAGATATDTLDGVITDRIQVDGNTVNDANAFNSARSCREILRSANMRSYGEGKKEKLSSGMYYITVFRASTASYHRQLVHCDMDTPGPNSDEPVGYTYAHCGSASSPCKQVTPYSKAPGSCAELGLEMADFQGKEKSCEWIKQRYSVDFPADFDCSKPTTSEVSVNYICGTNDELLTSDEFMKHKNTHKTDHFFQASNNAISEAEAGMYVIYYHVQDTAGNKECETPSRTVVVKDTLPPVITLHLRNKMIHKSNEDQQGLLTNNKQSMEKRAVGNPAFEKKSARGSNPHLEDDYSVNYNPSQEPRFPTGPVNGYRNYMAEKAASSVNGWVMGAALSAVAGVAMLAVSRGKQVAEVEV